MNKRHPTILELLKENRHVDIQELATQFSVSPMTIRRDLDEMAQQGLLMRTHGGAVATAKLRFVESVLPGYRPASRMAAIGRLAASAVEPGQTIMIDSGMTTLEVARHLPKDIGITVATTSLCVAQELYGFPINIIIIGGLMRREFPSVYGPLSESMLAKLHVDTLFIGCNGADSRDGFYSSDPRVSDLDQCMARVANRIVIVTESWKFGHKALVRFASLEDVHTVVTDADITPEDRANLEDAGISLLIAEEQAGEKHES